LEGKSSGQRENAHLTGKEKSHKNVRNQPMWKSDEGVLIGVRSDADPRP